MGLFGKKNCVVCGTEFEYHLYSLEAYETKCPECKRTEVFGPPETRVPPVAPKLRDLSRREILLLRFNKNGYNKPKENL